MDTIVHSLSDGRRITVRIKRNARKNIILRPMAADVVSATIPPWLGRRQLSAWLSEREDLLLSVLSRAAVLPVEESLPSKLWLHGEQLDLVSGGHEGVLLLPSRVSVAEAGAEEQKELLRKEWRRRAAETLLPRLVGHAGRLEFQPAAVALSNAKTFWGVCRRTTGIRLNWRLVGAPDFVVDYVCVHELCHLPHPNHSRDFWSLVNRHTPHTQAAKLWLKQYGRELFVLG